MDKGIIQTFVNYFYPEQTQNINIHRSHVSSKCLIVFRIIAFLYLTGIYLWTLLFFDSLFTNFVYFTLQSYFVTWLYFTVSLQDYLLNHMFSKPISKKLNMWSQTLFQLSFCNEVVVTLVFWVFLFKIVLQIDGITTQIIILNANLHGGPFILLAIDLFLNPFCFNTRRIFIVFVFGLLYMILNCVYTLTYRIIYRPINWVSPLSYLLVCLSLIIVAAVFILGNFLYIKCKKDKLQTQDTIILRGLIEQDKQDPNKPTNYNLEL